MFVEQPLVLLGLLIVVVIEDRLKGKSTWLLVLVRITSDDARIGLTTDITQIYTVEERVPETNQETECVKKRHDCMT